MGRVRVLKFLQVSPIVPVAGIPGEPFHVDRADGTRRDSQSLDHLQQADSLEDDLPIRLSNLTQRIPEGRSFEPIKIAQIFTLIHSVTACADGIHIEGMRELSCKKGSSSPTRPIDADGPNLSASRTDLIRKGSDIREAHCSAVGPKMSGLVKFHARVQQSQGARTDYLPIAPERHLGRASVTTSAAGFYPTG